MREKPWAKVGLLYESQRWRGRGKVYANVRPLAVRRPSVGTARLAAVVAISGNDSRKRRGVEYG